MHLLYRVDKDMHVNCELQAFNSIVIKQVAASLEEEASNILIQAFICSVFLQSPPPHPIF